MFRSILRINSQLLKRTLIARPFKPTLSANIRKVVWKPLNEFHSSRFVKEQEEQANAKHQMLIGFTCKVCQERSHHVMSKIAYTKGVVLIQCPGCKNRHLIADNLGWFRDSKTTVEDLVKEKGEAIRKVVVDDQGVERMSDLMEWLPDIVQEEKAKKEQQQQAKIANKDK